MTEVGGATTTGAAARPWSWRWHAWGLAGVAGAAAGLVLRAWAPSSHPEHTICAFRALVHVDCPTCGLTRSLAYLARGEWAASVALHPFGVILVAELAAIWIVWGASLARGRPRRWGGAVLRLAAVDAAFLFALWLARFATGTLPS